MNKKYLVIIPAVIVIILLIAFILYPEKSKEITESQKIKVATTIFPLNDIVKNIAQDKVEVVNLVPPGASPHTFEVTPSKIKDLEGAKTLFSIGHGLDDWTQDIVRSLPGIEIFTTDASIQLKQLEHGHSHDESEKNDSEKDDKDKEEGLDPHYWLSFQNGKIIAANIADELIEIDPDNKEFYRENLRKYDESLNKSFNESFDKLNSLDKKELIVFHESWNYFSDEFNLKIIGVFESSPGVEPTSQDLVNLQKITLEHNIKSIFSEPQFSPETIRPFVEDLGLKLHTLDPIGGVEGRNSYIDLLLYNTDTIYKAFKNE